MDKIKARYTNAELAALKPAERRMVIAQDVIKLLKARKLVARDSNLYLDADFGVDLSAKENENKQLKSVLKDMSCTVCAIGAAFVAGVGRFSDLTVQEAHPITNAKFSGEVRGTMSDYLQRFGFSNAQLDLIERAFEGTDTFNVDRLAIYNFYSRYPASNDRLIAIMQNIIKNKGTFVLEQ